MKDKILKLIRDEFSGEELIKTECALLLAYYGYIECVDKLDNSYNVPKELSEAMKKFYQLPDCIITRYSEENGVILKEITELNDKDLSRNFQIYYNVNIRYRFGIELTHKELNHYYCCMQQIDDNILGRNALKRLLKNVSQSKYNYKVRMHDKNKIPAVVLTKSASGNYDISFVFDKKKLYSFYSKEEIIFNGKRNYTLSQLIEKIDKKNDGKLRIDNVFDYFISGLGNEGVLNLCEIDNENKYAIFTRR